MKKLSLCILIGAILLLLSACNKNDPLPESFTLTATVTELGEKIAVEIIEAPYENSGVFLVITPNDTVYLNSDGGEISREDISVGDRVEITYGGQVMMSYPAQIVASRIQIL